MVPTSAPADAGDLAATTAIFALTVLVHGLIYRRRLTPATGPMGFLEHLRELGARVARIGLVFVYWIVVFTAVRFERVHLAGLPIPVPVADLFDNTAARLYLFLARSSLPEGVQIIVTRPTEAIGAQIQVALLLAFVLAFPALIYETWAFFSPAMKPRERRAFARALPLAGLLFGGGVLFAYLFIVPTILGVLYAFAGPLEAAQYLTAGALVSTLVTFALLFGLAFELPLVMVLLVRIGVLSPGTYARKWRHVTVAIFVVAALVTDPTVVSQLIVAAMLLALYWSGVLLSVLAGPIPADASRVTEPGRAA